MNQGPEGNLLMHDVADATESLVPRHNYIPWLVVNKEHTDEIQVRSDPWKIEGRRRRSIKELIRLQMTRRDLHSDCTMHTAY